MELMSQEKKHFKNPTTKTVLNYMEMEKSARQR